LYGSKAIIDYNCDKVALGSIVNFQPNDFNEEKVIVINYKMLKWVAIEILQIVINLIGKITIEISI